MDTSNFKMFGATSIIYPIFCYFSYEFLNYIKNDKTYLEKEPLEKITKKKQLSAFKHNGFWQCMDTLRDKENIEKILQKKNFK